MMDRPDVEIDLESLVNSYRDGVDRELEARLTAWPLDFARIQVHEVIGGMLARQATLVKELANARQIWNGHTAPILLRAMADAYINITWMLLDPELRCLRFIAFGLGQAKLELEHRRNGIDRREPTSEETAMIAAQERWIERQRALFLQDVDLGSWAGLSVRQMADEAGCIDFYNFVYAPFSGCAHSTWWHIGRYDLVECKNPLHRYHRRPESSAAESDINYLVLAAKYWLKTLNAFDTTFAMHIECSSAYDALIVAISAQEAFVADKTG